MGVCLFETLVLFLGGFPSRFASLRCFVTARKLLLTFTLAYCDVRTTTPDSVVRCYSFCSSFLFGGLFFPFWGYRLLRWSLGGLGVGEGLVVLG